MSSCICKQPNGLYCRFSSIVDTMTHINMTFDDYINVLMERNHYSREKAVEEATDIFKNYLHDYKECEDRILIKNETIKSREQLITKMKQPANEVSFEVR